MRIRSEAPRIEPCGTPYHDAVLRLSVMALSSTFEKDDVVQGTGERPGLSSDAFLDNLLHYFALFGR